MIHHNSFKFHHQLVSIVLVLAINIQEQITVPYLLEVYLHQIELAGSPLPARRTNGTVTGNFHRHYMIIVKQFGNVVYEFHSIREWSFFTGREAIT